MTLMHRLEHRSWRGLGDAVNKKSKAKNHPLLKRNYAKHAIPVMLHGDGAEFESNDSLMTISMRGLLKEGP